MAARIARLYRHPVKGLTPEAVEHLDVSASGAVAGDRVLGLLLGDAGPPPRGEWWPKASFVTLMTTPGLARVAARFDGAARRLELRLPSGETLSTALDDEGERRALEAALTSHVAALEGSPLRGHPERVPLRLVGDGATPRYHDRGANHVTLLNSASIASLEEALGAPVDERRFRGNVILEGLEPWAELAWEGRTLALGSARLRVSGVIVRCQATHTDPTSGEWDLPVLTTLVRAFAQERPVMGVLAVPVGGSQALEVGAPVALEPR